MQCEILPVCRILHIFDERFLSAPTKCDRIMDGVAGGKCDMIQAGLSPLNREGF